MRKVILSVSTKHKGKREKEFEIQCVAVSEAAAEAMVLALRGREPDKGLLMAVTRIATNRAAKALAKQQTENQHAGINSPGPEAGQRHPHNAGPDQRGYCFCGKPFEVSTGVP